MSDCTDLLARLDLNAIKRIGALYTAIDTTFFLAMQPEATPEIRRKTSELQALLEVWLGEEQRRISKAGNGNG